jgi:N-acetyl-alpha-D-muramate 1-phosphate uridylyltransferase
MKAMILAAGLGTRLKPWTDKHPKALALVNGKSLLQRNIEYLQTHGIADVIVNVHHFPTQIIDAINNNKGWGSNIHISDESDEVLETGGGLVKAKSFLQSDSFVLMNVDMLTDLDLSAMIQFHNQNKALATLGISDRQSSRAFLFDIDNKLCGWQNSITGEQKIKVHNATILPKAFSGFHVIEPNIFELITQEGKFGMVDVYLELCNTQNILGFNHTGCKLLDVGKPESIAIAESLFV